VNGPLYRWCDVSSFYVVAGPASEAEAKLFRDGLADHERNHPAFCEHFLNRLPKEAGPAFVPTIEFELPPGPPRVSAASVREIPPEANDLPLPPGAEPVAAALPPVESDAKPGGTSDAPRPRKVRFVAFGSVPEKRTVKPAPAVESAEAAVQASPPLRNAALSVRISRPVDRFRTFDLLEIDPQTVFVVIAMNSPDVLCWSPWNKFVAIDADELDMAPLIREDAVLRDANRERVGARDRVRLVGGLVPGVEGTVVRTFDRYLFLQLDENRFHLSFWWALASDAEQPL
jgi:hypothetical protein